MTAVVVSARAMARVRNGHPWVYRSDVESANDALPGAWVQVHGPRGQPLGTALYSSASQIALRMWTQRLSDREPEFAPLLQERLASAWALRERVVENSDACRLVFSEADFLPGLILDRYNDVISFQAVTQAMDSSGLRDLVLGELVTRFQPAGIVERVDARSRNLEQLPERDSELVCGSKTQTMFTMNGVRFHYDALAGQKTGSFLDQRENYAAAAKYARGHALDVFCYEGGFALHLARRCEQVSGVDSSRPALETADRNAALNGVEVEWIEANAFDLLKDYASAGRRFDTIVLDPPAFAKTRRSLPGALRGYKELNLRALKMLRPGGLLVTCSCSYHVSEADFLHVLAEAALDAGRQAQILERRTQARDHPILLTMPESQYLKCILLLVS